MMRCSETARALAEAFDGPWTYLVTGVQDEGGFDPCAQTLGVPFISTELGDGARLGRETLEIGRRGVRNMLSHLGVIESVRTGREGAGSSNRYLTDRGPEGSLVSEAVGFLETLLSPGDTVTEGQSVARVHPVENGFESPAEMAAPRGGVIVAQRTTAHVKHGDVVMIVASEIDRKDLIA